MCPVRNHMISSRSVNEPLIVVQELLLPRRGRPEGAQEVLVLQLLARVPDRLHGQGDEQQQQELPAVV